MKTKILNLIAWVIAIPGCLIILFLTIIFLADESWKEILFIIGCALISALFIWALNRIYSNH